MANMNLQGINKGIKPATFKSIIGKDSIKERFNSVFKNPQKSAQFLASVSSAVSSSSMLQSCNPNEIIVCAGIAASLNLDVNPNLGFSAIIPFNKSNNVNGQWIKTPHPQFQIMTKGYVQLAQRTGQYIKLNVTEVYADELLGINYITGDVRFDETGGTQRREGKEENIVGYCAYMKLVNGFEHYEYWDKEKIKAHAIKYSMSYQSDIKYNAKKTLWSTDFPAMAKKTVLKAMLKKWGVLSTQMQSAIIADEATSQIDGEYQYGDNQKDVVLLDEMKDSTVTEPTETTAPKESIVTDEDDDLDNIDFGDTGLL